jgi:MFS family permease
MTDLLQNLGSHFMASPDTPRHMSRGGLYFLLGGLLLPQIDFSIVNVALDPISRSLGASEMELELVVAVYGVAFAVCLAMGGRLGDNFGRRRLFGWGVAIFSLASLLCGLAHAVWFMLAARTLQGVGAALSVPQILATIHVSLRGHEHSKALGLYGAINGLAFVFGQILGGFLVTADVGGLGWRNVFLINLPIGAAILAGMRRFIPETYAESAARVDGPGTILLALVIACLLIPMALGPVLRWPVWCVGLLAAAAPLVWALSRAELRQERRGAHPLLPPSLFRLPSMRFGLCFAVLFFGSFSGFMFAMALTFQIGAGLSSLQSGNAFVALGASFFLGSLLTTRAFTRYAKTTVLLLGCAVQIAGILGLIVTLRLVWPSPDVLNILAASVLIGFGQAFMVGCFYRIGLAEVPTAQAGAGSAMLSTVQQASFGLGPALFGAVLTQSLRRTGGDYLDSASAVLAVEACLMLLLVVVALVQRLKVAA